MNFRRNLVNHFQRGATFLETACLILIIGFAVCSISTFAKSNQDAFARAECEIDENSTTKSFSDRDVEGGGTCGTTKPSVPKLEIPVDVDNGGN